LRGNSRCPRKEIDDQHISPKVIKQNMAGRSSHSKLKSCIIISKGCNTRSLFHTERIEKSDFVCVNARVWRYERRRKETLRSGVLSLLLDLTIR